MCEVEILRGVSLSATHAPGQTPVHTHPYTHTPVHTHLCTHTPMRTHTHTHTPVHTHPCTHTPVHTHTRTHTLWLECRPQGGRKTCQLTTQSFFSFFLSTGLGQWAGEAGGTGHAWNARPLAGHSPASLEQTSHLLLLEALGCQDIPLASLAVPTTTPACVLSVQLPRD